MPGWWRLLELRADVVCVVRDWVRQSELIYSELIARTKVVRADILDRAAVERDTLSEYEVDTVLLVITIR